MSKLHMKGFILCQLNEHHGGLWDFEIAEKVLSEYKYSGRYWRGEVRATLVDMFSGALLEKIEDRLDDKAYFGTGKILIKFKLTSFGRRRMISTGIMPG